MRRPSHILVATDGSPRSRRAARVAARLARKTQGRLTAVYVVVEGVPSAFSGAGLYASPALSAKNRAFLRQQADQALAGIEAEARRQGVPCGRLRARARHPWKAIISAARRRRCGMIVMGSHGRGGLAGAILGSETIQVLAHSKIPVLVCR